jgi:hypothetical protein
MKLAGRLNDAWLGVQETHQATEILQDGLHQLLWKVGEQTTKAAACKIFERLPQQTGSESVHSESGPCKPWPHFVMGARRRGKPARKTAK